MSLSNVTVVSGQMSYEKMTHKLKTEDYAAVKAHVWLHMLQDGMNPTKWFRPNGKGTKVNFVPLATREDAEQAMVKFKEYLSEINEQYGFEFELIPNEGSERV